MADRVTMKALDTMHISNVQAGNLTEGDVFTVSEAEAKILEDRGLAERGGTASKAVNADAASTDRPDTREEIDAERGLAEGKAIGAAPANKQVDVTANKTISARTASAKRRK
jgi:hypothetical protein